MNSPIGGQKSQRNRRCLTYAIGVLLSFGTIALNSCKINDEETERIKPLVLGGNADPVVSGGWRKMGEFFHDDVRVEYIFTIGDKAYFRVRKAGPEKSEKPETNFWEYDPKANRFSPKGRLPSRYGNDANTYNGCLKMVIDGVGYFGLGSAGNTDADPGYSREVWKYDPTSDSWSRQQDFPTQARFPKVFVIESVGYVMGWGIESGFTTDSMLVYNPSADTWTFLDKDYQLWPQRISAHGHALNGKGYIIGENYFGSFCIAEFDSDSFKIKSKIELPEIQVPEITFAIGDKMYFYFGNSFNFQSNTIYVYDPKSNTYSEYSTFGGIIRRYSEGFSIGEKSYIGFGKNNTTDLNDLWEYNP